VAAGTRETFIPDIQDSVMATLDSGSGALTKAGYLPFGENASATTGTFRFIGQRFDAETAGSVGEPSGLYYYRARMYSPTLGRFMQPDPIGYQGGVHLYAYVGNDPLNLTDPLGLWTLQFGLSFNIQLGPVALQFSSGFAVDNHGNLARIDVGGASGGVGERFSGGVSVGASNADDVGQLSSWFNNASVGVAAGPSASLDAFQGIDSATGKNVVGGGGTVGFGLGGGGSVGKTYTIVTPLNYDPSTLAPAGPSAGGVAPSLPAGPQGSSAGAPQSSPQMK